MSRHRRKRKLTDEAQARIDLGSEMVGEVLRRGGIPEILIGAKPGNAELHALDYFIVSPLDREKVRYVLSRVIGLLVGSIQEKN